MNKKFIGVLSIISIVLFIFLLKTNVWKYGEQKYGNDCDRKHVCFL